MSGVRANKQPTPYTASNVENDIAYTTSILLPGSSVLWMVTTDFVNRLDFPHPTCWGVRLSVSLCIMLLSWKLAWSSSIKKSNFQMINRCVQVVSKAFLKHLDWMCFQIRLSNIYNIDHIDLVSPVLVFSVIKRLKYMCFPMRWSHHQASQLSVLLHNILCSRWLQICKSMHQLQMCHSRHQKPHLFHHSLLAARLPITPLLHHPQLIGTSLYLEDNNNNEDDDDDIQQQLY